MLRLFVGIDFPPELKLRLSLLCTGVPGARWVDPGNFHLTLRFIGEISEDLAADVDEALAGIKASRFTLQLAGTGVFGGAPPACAVGRGRAQSPSWSRLRDKIEQALIRAGLRAGAAQIRAARHPGAAARSGARQARSLPRRARAISRRSAAGRAFQPDRQLPDQGRLGLRGSGRLPAVGLNSEPARSGGMDGNGLLAAEIRTVEVFLAADGGGSAAPTGTGCAISRRRTICAR